MQNKFEMVVITMKVMVETSARHIHVSRADFEKLFGADAQLTKPEIGSLVEAIDKLIDASR